MVNDTARKAGQRAFLWVRGTNPIFKANRGSNAFGVKMQLKMQEGSRTLFRSDLGKGRTPAHSSKHSISKMGHIKIP